MVKNRRFEDQNARNFGARHLQCLLLFCGICVFFGMRVNFSVGIVAMTDKNAANPDFPEYQWSEKIKSLLLSGFFWGYICTQIPGGQLATKFGGKTILLYSMLISSILSLLTPLLTALGDWQLLFAVRIILGFGQGILFPTTHTLLSKWVPTEERGVLGTCTYAGGQLGTVIMLATSGHLASSSYGWPSLFYVSGIAGLLWVIAWFLWGASTPAECRYIKTDEKEMIETALNVKDNGKSVLKTPWIQILTSIPFLVLGFVQCAYTWMFTTLLTQIPNYMKNVLQMDIKSNALLSALPYTAMFILNFVFSGISALLTKYNTISIAVSRKLFNTIGFWIPMISLIGLGYVDASKSTLAIALLTLTVGVGAACHLGFVMNHIDLSPNFAGIMMGMTNCIANIMSILAPLTVGFVVNDVKNPEQWRIIFFIASGYAFIGNLLFIIFGQAKVQSWNDAPIKESQEFQTIDNKNARIESRN